MALAFRTCCRKGPAPGPTTGAALRGVLAGGHVRQQPIPRGAARRTPVKHLHVLIVRELQKRFFAIPAPCGQPVSQYFKTPLMSQ